MKIQSIKQNQNYNTFGHTFKVSICVRDSENSMYEFVHPKKNRVLYKKLNSTLVGWLNNDYLTRLKESMGILRKKSSRIQTERNMIGKKQITELLTCLDSDYRKLPQVRSVYTRRGLAYIATGDDANVIKKECGAEEIGIEKHKAKELFGNRCTQEVKNAVISYKKKSIKYVKSSEHLLRSPNSGRELMLRLNFIKTGAKNNQPVYEFDNCEFYAIKSSIE